LADIVVKMNLEMLENELGNIRADLSRLKQVRGTVVNIIEYSRNVMNELRPSALDDLGLIPSIRGLIGQAEKRLNLRVNLFESGGFSGIDPERALTIYRIVQESLNNIIKHAEASHVFVNIVNRKTHIALNIEDNGVGFNYGDLDSLKESGIPSLGVMIMKERAAMVGGELHVESKPGKGTTIIAEIPT
jgi:signal transduction histidine kinase